MSGIRVTSVAGIVVASGAAAMTLGVGCGNADGVPPDVHDDEAPLVGCATGEDTADMADAADAQPAVKLRAALHRASFTGIGDLPGGAFLSEARDVDGRGRRVVGTGTGASGTQAVVWTRRSGLLALAESPSAASAISASGCVIAGAAETLRPPPEGLRTMAARWVGRGPIELVPEPTPSLYTFSEAIAVSGDGQLILGIGRQSVASQSGFIWRGDTFSNSPPYNFENLAANADGSVLVGRVTPSRYGGPAYAIRNGEALPYPFEPDPECTGFCLPCITPGQCSAAAYGVSADGNVIVGSATNDAAGEPSVAVQWTVAADEITPSILSTSGAIARAVSADGRVVVGSETHAGQSVATRWVEGYTQSVAAGLQREGVSLDGWHLDTALAVSANGRVIVGTGTNPDGDTEGWVATFP